MKHGDLVILKNVGRPGARRAVALRVTSADLRKGLDVRRPGLYLFRGYWYGTDPLAHSSYGKLEGQVGKVVGRLRSHRQARQLKL